MKNNFFLNDCLPDTATDIHETVSDFLKDFIKLRSANNKFKVGEMFLSDGYYSLMVCSVKFSDIINSFSDDKFKTTVIVLLSKARIIDDLLADAEDYDDLEIYADALFDGYNATNLLIAAKTDLIIASMPLQQYLQTDQISVDITADSVNKQLQVDNFYGSNSQYIINKFSNYNFETNLDKLHAELGGDEKVKISEEFIDTWHYLGKIGQSIIINRFLLAKEKNMLFPPRADDNLIKYDENGTGVYELRTKSGKRIYFGDKNGILHIALYATKSKPSGSDQSADFKHAKFIIDNM